MEKPGDVSHNASFVGRSSIAQIFNLKDLLCNHRASVRLCAEEYDQAYRYPKVILCDFESTSGIPVMIILVLFIKRGMMVNGMMTNEVERIEVEELRSMSMYEGTSWYFIQFQMCVWKRSNSLTTLSHPTSCK